MTVTLKDVEDWVLWSMNLEPRIGEGGEARDGCRLPGWRSWRGFWRSAGRSA